MINRGDRRSRLGRLDRAPGSDSTRDSNDRRHRPGHRRAGTPCRNLRTTRNRHHHDLSPGYAFRIIGRGEREWRLTWLPQRRLSREEPRAGMELDELLSDPAVVYGDRAHAAAAQPAERLGIGVDRAVILLAQRLAERLHLDADEDTARRDEQPPFPIDRDSRPRPSAHAGALTSSAGLNESPCPGRDRTSPTGGPPVRPSASAAGRLPSQARVLCSAPTASERLV